MSGPHVHGAWARRGVMNKKVCLAPQTNQELAGESCFSVIDVMQCQLKTQSVFNIRRQA